MSNCKQDIPPYEIGLCWTADASSFKSVFCGYRVRHTRQHCMPQVSSIARSRVGVSGWSRISNHEAVCGPQNSFALLLWRP